MEAFNHLLYWLRELRDSANSYLSQYEPLLLILTPILTFVFAGIVQSFISVIHEKGLRAISLELVMSCVK